MGAGFLGPQFTEESHKFKLPGNPAGRVRAAPVDSVSLRDWLHFSIAALAGFDRLVGHVSYSLGTICLNLYTIHYHPYQ